MRRMLMGVLLAAVAAGAVGCATGSGYTTAAFNTSFVRIVAVSHVQGPVPGEEAGLQVAGIVAEELRARGYMVTTIGITPPVIPVSAGAPPMPVAYAAGSDATMNISVTEWGEHVSMMADLIDNRTSQVVWSGVGSGDTEQIWATIGGAAAGALAGAAIGGPEHRAGGAVIGGVVGGTTGYVLSPKEGSVAREIARQMLRSLPPAR